MAPRVRNMTEGSSIKQILSFALPLMLGTIFQQFYNMVDTMVAGYTLGDRAISAIFLIAGLGFLGVCITEPACWALMAALLGGTYLLKYRATLNGAA